MYLPEAGCDLLHPHRNPFANAELISSLSRSVSTSAGLPGHARNHRGPPPVPQYGSERVGEQEGAGDTVAAEGPCARLMGAAFSYR